MTTATAAPDSYLSNLSNLWKTHNKRLNWESKTILIGVADDLKDPDTAAHPINLVDTIGKTRRPNLKGPKCWPPPKFDENNDKFRREVLVPHFVDACIKDGFNVTSKGWEERNQVHVMMCNRGRDIEEVKAMKKKKKASSPEDDSVSPDVSVSSDSEEDSDGCVSDKSETDLDHMTGDHCPTLNPSEKPVRRSHRPLRNKEEKCSFTFRIYWCKKNSRWFLPQKQGGNTKHCGHIQREEEECRRMARHCGLDTLKLVEQCFNACLRPSQISELILCKEGKHVDPKVTADCHKRLRNANVFEEEMVEQSEEDPNNSTPRETSSGKHKPTAADRLLANLRKREDASCTALHAKWDSELLSVHKQTKKSKEKAVSEKVRAEDIDMNDETETTQDCATEVRNALKVSGTSCILLAMAWTTDEAHRLLQMFPEFSGSDTVHGTNSEKRKLLTYCGKDGNDEAFIHAWAFLPSESRWVFHWFFGDATPALHGEEVSNKKKVQLTDQDRQEIDGFKDSQAEGCCKEAKHRTCSFHKIDRNFASEGQCASLVRISNKEEDRKIELKTIATWLFKFPMECEAQEECEVSLQLFDECLNLPVDQKNGELTPELKQGAHDFIFTKFKDNGPNMFRCNFFDKCCHLRQPHHWGQRGLSPRSEKEFPGFNGV